MSNLPLQAPAFGFTTSVQGILASFRTTNTQYRDSFGALVFEHPIVNLSFVAIGNFILKGWACTGQLAVTAKDTIESFESLVQADSLIPLAAYFIRFVLVGRDPDHATPAIVVTCEDETTSHQLKRIIVDSNNLPPGWVCIMIPAQIYATMESRESLISGRMADDAPFEVYISGDIVPRCLNAVRVEIRQNGSSVGEATIGGVLQLGDEAYALTVAHCFYIQQRSTPQTFEIDESELQFLFDTNARDDSGMEGEVAAVTSQQKQVSESDTRNMPIESSDTLPVSPERRIMVGHLAEISSLGKTIYSSARNSDRGLDWALVRLQNQRIAHTNRYHFRSPKDITEVVLNDLALHSSPKPIRCHLLSPGIFGLPSVAQPQPVTAFRVYRINVGDSGSWVVDSDNHVLGMAVGACQPFHEVYAISMTDIWRDIEQKLKYRPAFARQYGPNWTERRIAYVERLLHDPETRVRELAMTVINLQGELLDTLCDVIVKQIHNSGWFDQTKIIEHLGDMADLAPRIWGAIEAQLEKEDEDTAVQISAIKALGKRPSLSDVLLEKVEARLGSSNFYARRSAVEVLRKQSALPDALLEKIAARLDNASSDIRFSAVEVLGKQSALPDALLEKIAARLDNASSDIRFSAVEVLGKQATLSDALLEKIAARLGDDDSSVRYSAVEVLGKQAVLSDALLEKIAVQLEHTQSIVRLSAIYALGQHLSRRQ